MSVTLPLREGMAMFNNPDTLSILATAFAIIGILILLSALLAVSVWRLARAKSSLRESEARYRRIVDTAREGIWEMDADYLTVYVNQVMADMLGYERAEMVGRHVSSFMFEEDLQDHGQKMAARARGLDQSYERRFRKKEGNEVWARVQATALKDEQGRFLGSFAMFTDISEQKRVLEALRALTSRHQAILEAIPDIIMEVDADKVYRWANRAGFGFFGEDVLGKAADCYFEGEQDTYGIVQPLFSGDENVIYVESWQRRKDGERRLLAWWCRVLKDANGEVTGALSTARDITGSWLAEEALAKSHRELQQTVQELEQSRNMLKLVVESIPVRVFWKDRDLRYLGCNTLFARDAGLSRPEQLLGRDDFAMGWKEQAEFYRADDRHVMECGIPKLNYVEPQTTPAGARIWLNTSKVPLQMPNGEAFGVLGVYEDITDRKRADEERRSLEERLRRAEKMEALGTMAGGVAHDLNNVLGIVVGYSELLADEVAESSAASPYVKEIQKGAERAASIVQDLLTLARRGVPSRQVLSLNSIVLECRNSPEFAKVLLDHPNLRVKTELESDLLYISGSPIHLGKSFMNLVYNAAEAMPRGGILAVKTANCYLDKTLAGYDEVREGDYVVLRVADTGEGIPDADLKRIFEPFYTKKVMGRSGTGLGLAVVWGTIRDHLGYVNVESEEGKGTTFTLYFPVTREEPAREEAFIAVAEYMGQGECILVVDDVLQQRELAEKILTKLNYRVTTVAGGEEAVEYLRQHKVDLVVLDMIMEPGLDGLDTYRRILEIQPRQKAIIVSGFAETERVTKAQELGAGAYVKKPYVLEKLGVACRRELDRSR